ncbi:MAG: filamentous hemagglutinin N-terminal domain-containing protein [Alphaproteobacteria bacterium]|nr:MAG: filamentous hemagglutinin N-terminal domain-containing protein [Alphaproteobacteria bacterium]
MTEGTKTQLNKPWLLATTALCSLVVFAAQAATPAPRTLPQGGSVVAGNAGISTSGANMTVNQSSSSAVINWNKFDVGSQAKVQFNQPDASSRTLNRVLSSDPSQIYGQVTANGQLYFVNPNGVIVGQGARIEAGSITATTMDIGNDAFMAGANSFSRGSATGEIVNQGTLAAAPKGYVALIGAKVTNKGTITAPQGQVAMAAGDKVTLPVTGSGLIGIEVDAASVQTAITNEGTITAPDGSVYIKAETASSLGAQIVNKGTITAKNVAMQSASGSVTTSAASVIAADNVTARAKVLDIDGSVRTFGDTAQIGLYAGYLSLRGSLEAQNANGTGGAIEAVGTQETNLFGAKLTASGMNGGGTIKIGGDAQGSGTLQRSAQTTVDKATTLKASALATGDGGTVIVWSDGKTSFAGSIEATSATGKGGNAEVSGKVKLSYQGYADLRGASGTAGTLLLDPTDFTVAASGGDMTGAALSAQLEGANVTLLSSNGSSGTAGNININDTVSWSSAFGLTLSAAADININAAITTSTGLLTLTTGSASYSTYVNANVTANRIVSTYDTILVKAETATVELTGSSPALTIAGTSYTLINNLSSCNSMTLSGAYALNANIGTATVPIGSSATPFTGKINGLGHTVTVNITASGDNTGLFGYASLASIKNIGVSGSVSATTTSYTGALVGYSVNSTILNSWSTATVHGQNYVGGLVGQNTANTSKTASIIMSYAKGAVTSETGSYYVGGLVGENLGTASGSSAVVTSSYAIGAVTGTNYVGGLIGYNYSNTSGTAPITSSYATGNVTADYYAGGLIGYNYGQSSGNASINSSYATGAVGSAAAQYAGGLIGWNNTNNGTASIELSYATGAVQGAYYLGGLVGYNYGNSSGTASIANSYATGSVTGDAGGQATGGLVGWNKINSGTAPITASYAVGAVSGGTYVGGLTGLNSGTVTSSYWDTQTTGQATSTSGTGMTTAQLKSALPSGFSAAVWRISAGTSYPDLLWKGIPQQVISGTIGSVLAGQTIQLVLNGAVLGSALTNASGAFTISVSSGAVGAGSSVLLYADNSSFTGTYVGVGTGGDMTGLALGSGGVKVTGAAATALDVTALMKSAVGGLTDSDILYTTASSSVTVGGNLAVTAFGVVSQTDALIVSGTTSVSATGSALAFTNAANSLTGTVSVAAAQSISITNNRATSLGAITASGDILVRANGSIAIESGSVLTSSAGGIDLVASGDHFINNGTGAALSAATSWHIYTASPTGNTLDGLSYNYSQYGASYGDTLLGTGNGLIYASSLATTQVSVTGAISKVYDAADTATVGLADVALTTTGLSGATYTYSVGAASYDSKNVGTGKTVTAAVTLTGITEATGQAVYGFTSSLSGSGAVGEITAKTLTVTGTTVSGKVYNGDTVATVNVGSAALAGVVGVDAVSLGTGSAVGAFADKNVGTGKSVTASGFTITGTDAGNYTLAQPTGLSADVTAKTITVTGVMAATKTYDTTAAASLNVGSATLSGVYGSDVVGLDASGASGVFADKNVGTGKGVTVTALALNGADAGNYVLTQPTGVQGTINKANLTVTGVTAGDKVYDGSLATSVDATGAVLSGVLGTDAVSLITIGASAAFADKNAGTNKSVNVYGLALTGVDAANYDVATIGVVADISRKDLTYQVANATTNKGQIQLGAVTFSGLVGGDSVGAVSELVDAGGNVVSVSASIPAGTYTQRVASLTGGHAANYHLQQTGSTFGTLVVGHAVHSVSDEKLNMMNLLGMWYDKERKTQEKPYDLQGLQVQEFLLEKGRQIELIRIPNGPKGKKIRIQKLAQNTSSRASAQ